MVSILLDIIKFLLIYRYLQNAYWFKRGDVYIKGYILLKVELNNIVSR